MAYTLIDDPSAYFQTALYAGNNTTDHNITNDGNSDLQPDFVWIKQRTSNNPHMLQDSSRGFAGNGEVNVLQSNSDGAEATNGAFESFNTNGFGVGGTNVASGAYNLSGSNYVAWQWKANGGTTASNTDGTITSTVQANQDAGFSIVTYTGNGTDGATVGHGLGAVPAMVLFKCRDTSNTDWRIYHQSISPTNALSLNSAGAQYGASGVFGGTFTSTLLKVENDTGANRNTSPMIAYCFAEKQGYSKFGSYKGNGTGTSDGTFDGTFVYTGFKPAWVMVKRSSYSAGDGWTIWDNAREPRGTFGSGNYINNKLTANSAGAESGNVYDAVDFLSNGFKLRTGRAGTNASGSTYIYMAFAESPFTSSTGIPTTAR